MSGFTCRNLSPDQVRVVFPLIREAVPALDMKAWLRFARRMTNPRRTDDTGIMVVYRRSRKLPCGLFLYHRENDLAHGSVLVAEHFIAVDVLDPQPVMRALTAELDALAGRLGCSAIRAMVLREDSIAETSLYAAGHRPAGAALWKDVPATKPEDPKVETNDHSTGAR